MGAPARWTCRLDITGPHGMQRASGVLVALGERTHLAVLTVGHALFHPQAGLATRVQISLAAQGDRWPWGQAAVGPEALAISQRWKEQADLDQDYGMIFFPASALRGARPEGAPITRLEDHELHGLSVMVTGYPVDQAPDGHPWVSAGTVQGCGPHRLVSLCDTGPGQAGGPLYAFVRGQWRCVGLHQGRGAAHQALRVTGHLIGDARRWADRFG